MNVPSSCPTSCAGTICPAPVTPSADGQHRCPRRSWRALHAGLCEQWRVRPEPDELLHRPLPISHGATWNRVPLRRRDDLGRVPARRRGRAGPVAGGQDPCAARHRGPQRLAIEGRPSSGNRLAQGGFREVERYDGHHEMGPGDAYSRFLRARGYDSERPGATTSSRPLTNAARSSAAGRCAMCTCRFPSGGGASRDGLHDQPGDRLHAPPGQPALGVVIELA